MDYLIYVPEKFVFTPPGSVPECQKSIRAYYLTFEIQPHLILYSWCKHFLIRDLFFIIKKFRGHLILDSKHIVVNLTKHTVVNLTLTHSKISEMYTCDPNFWFSWKNFPMIFLSILIQDYLERRNTVFVLIQSEKISLWPPRKKLK